MTVTRPVHGPYVVAGRTAVAAAAALAFIGLTSTCASAADTSAPAILQLFEASYATIERRAPDLFMAGYGGLWTPPPGRADLSNFSVGYDVYDRFDLGYAGNPTLYGTETGLKTTVAEVHKIAANVYTDLIWNHNGFTNNDTAGFQQAGGYPGFVLSRAGDSSGDFHPADATGDYAGRLGNLIDIAHEKNHQYIRNPVPGFANNIPAGTTPLFGRLANVPTEANRRFYPDLQGPSTTVNGVTYHGFSDDPSAGDPVAENATGYLMRHTRWMIEHIGVDGFRLDATKHMTDWGSTNPDWVLEFFDLAVNAGTNTPLLDGSRKRVFSFGEYLDTNIDAVQATIRKDATANRDALDFAMHYALKNHLSGNGLANDWRDLVNDSQDHGDDELANNGSQGVAFDASHDDGGAYLGNVANAYLLMRPGNAVVYMNAKEFGEGRDFPADGRGDALGGYYGNTITKLVDIRNTHGCGNYAERWIDKETLVFERQTSAIAGYNNRLDGGYDERTVNTSFAPGVHLVELTGNATDAVIDPNQPSNGGDIHDTVVVQPNGQITIRIPRNNSNGVEHGKGYVIYGLQNPQGSVSVSNVARTIAGEAATAANNGTARLTSIDVIKAPSFNLTLNTNAVTLSDGWRDLDADGDNALLRVDAGVNVNGNANVDYRTPGSIVYGFEEFTTTKSPGYGSATGNGTYVQTIDATQLGEGYHYLTARAFRHRAEGGEPIYTDFRKVVYVDQARPVSAIAELKPFGTDDRDVIVRSLDKTATGVHVFHNIGASQFTDAQLTAMAAGGSNSSGSYDRDLFKYGVFNLKNGNHAFTVVTFEVSYDPALGFAGGGVNVQRFAGFGFAAGGGQGFGDLDFNGTTNAIDVNTFDTVLRSNNTQYNPAAELNGDGVINLADTFLLGPRLAALNVSQQTWDRYNTMIHSPFVTSGTYTVTGAQNIFEDTAATTTVTTGAQLTASYVRGATLNVQDGGLARVRANGTNTGVSRLTNVNIAAAGELDLTDNDLIVDYAAGGTNPYADLRWLVVHGRETGDGITSSTAGADKVLAIIDNAEWGRSNFGGQSIDATTIVGKYTFFGDANLDGMVTGDDYLAIDAALGTGASWLDGDFNLDGAVTGDDYLAIDSNLGKGTANPLALVELKAEMIGRHAAMFGDEYLVKLAAVEAGGFQVVPEPGGLVLTGLLTGFLLRRPVGRVGLDDCVAAQPPAAARDAVPIPQATLHEVPHVS